MLRTMKPNTKMTKKPIALVFDINRTILIEDKAAGKTRKEEICSVLASCCQYFFFLFQDESDKERREEEKRARIYQTVEELSTTVGNQILRIQSSTLHNPSTCRITTMYRSTCTRFLEAIQRELQLKKNTR
eukprot:TRINITY_DN1214_c0_g1_i1.p2 TRINITY_DN1214_c0_g1~~TRINITY_DN1214_c0_g1_i1.p2  ORF type:complete len:131 (-),score=32.91 TRINITY_DN1214_c0_g1_i1:934-1326(-)